jgi:glycosyltransferase involved in cell wall biosynthesis
MRRWLDRKIRKIRNNLRERRLLRNGTRIRQLETVLAKLNRGQPVSGESTHVSTLDSLARLRALEAGAEPPLAVISVLPPEQTGIALASSLTFRDSPFPIHMFSAFATAADYMRSAYDPLLRGSNMRVFSIDAIDAFRGAVYYRAQLFVLGNSRHNLPSLRLLRREQSLPSQIPTYLQLHDPCMLDIAYLICEEERRGFRNWLATFYGEIAYESTSKMADQGSVAIRALIDDIPIDGIIAHSDCARRMIQAELPDVPVCELFLPAYRRTAPKRASDCAAIRIGSFGIPGRMKRTELVIEALEILKAKGNQVDFVLAGYGVADYARERCPPTSIEIELHNAPGIEDFERVMNSVDLAIQLRARNRGENSGAISQLLALGVPVIASRQGAFAQYGEAVRLVEADASANDLAEAILSEIADPLRRRLKIARYVESHSPAVFCARLREFIESNASDGTGYRRHAADQIPDFRSIAAE